MEKQDAVLIVCAHSDDQALGFGGTFAKYAKQGFPIYTIILSYGARSHPHLQEAFVIKTRVNEAQKANEILGGKQVFFLGLKEGKFIDSAKETNAEDKIKSIIEKYDIKKIFTHSSVDIDIPNRDHINTYTIVKSVCKYFDVELYSFTVWDFFRVNRKLNDSFKLVVDISQTFKIKLRALHAFQSQKMQMSIPYIQSQIYSFFNGLRYGHRFAEVFIKEK